MAALPTQLTRLPLPLRPPHQVSVVTLDKTGTLTKGSFQLVGCHPRPGWTEHQLLRLLGSLERGSSHPLAAAVLGYAAAQVSDAESRVESVEPPSNTSLLSR